MEEIHLLHLSHICRFCGIKEASKNITKKWRNVNSKTFDSVRNVLANDNENVDSQKVCNSCKAKFIKLVSELAHKRKNPTQNIDEILYDFMKNNYATGFTKQLPHSEFCDVCKFEIDVQEKDTDEKEVEEKSPLKRQFHTEEPELSPFKTPSSTARQNTKKTSYTFY